MTAYIRLLLEEGGEIDIYILLQQVL